MAQILPLPSVRASARSAGHFTRLGETGHRQLADLHAEGSFAPRRAVVDASKFHHQRELVSALSATGTEIILDTKGAELSAEAKFSGYAKAAPWAAVGGGRPLGPDHFAPGSPSDVLGQIARFAIANNVDAVLSPGHFLSEGCKSRWLQMDVRACVGLREALDREGGKHIAVDYLLIVPHVLLHDVSERGTLVQEIKDLPFDNLWVRASGFGADAGPLSTQWYIASLAALHNLGRPIVADYLGGLVGLAADVFGAISGFAEGIGERERFDAREWHKPPKSRDDDEVFGTVKRVPISGFGRTVTISELTKLAQAKGGRRLVACADRNCCAHGFDDMVANPKRHSIKERQRQINEIERVPDLNRVQHFLDGEMARADRLARQIKELKTGDIKLGKKISDHSHRMEKLRATLEHFHETRGEDLPRALPVVERRRFGQSRTGIV
jgi:hypothetical protein